MSALLQHTTTPTHHSPGAARFSGDWVDAAVVLGRGTIRVDTFDQGHLLVPEDFATLRAALTGPEADARTVRPAARPARPGVQFNAALGMLLVPGGHGRAGRSFFPVHPAGAATP